MSWRFFFKRFVPAFVAMVLFWNMRDEISDMLPDGGNGSTDDGS